MSKLWGLLTIELGSAFCRQYGNAGDPVYEIWSKELDQFTEKELVAGLEKFKNSGSTYMSLNIFRNHCKKEIDTNLEADKKAAKTLEGQRLICADIGDKSREKGKEAIKKLLGDINI